MNIDDKFVTVFLNDENFYETRFENDFGKVGGIVYRFSGLGNVDYLRFKNPDDSIVYEDDF